MSWADTHAAPAHPENLEPACPRGHPASAAGHGPERAARVGLERPPHRPRPAGRDEARDSLAAATTLPVAGEGRRPVQTARLAHGHAPVPPGTRGGSD